MKSRVWDLQGQRLAGNVAISSTVFTTVEGYSTKFTVAGQALVVMSAHGHLKADNCDGRVELSYFLNEEHVQKDGWGGANVLVKDQQSNPVAIKQMRMIHKGQHVVELRARQTGCPAAAAGFVMHIVVVPIARGDAQFALYHQPPLNRDGMPEDNLAAGGQARLLLTDGKTHIVPGIKLPYGPWFHYGMVYDGMLIKIYVNGKVVVEKEAPDLNIINADRSQPLRLGMDNDGHRGIRASMDNVRVWSKMLSGPELTSSMYSDTDVDSAGLVASFDMDEAALKPQTNEITSLKGGRIAVVVNSSTVAQEGTVRLKHQVMTGPMSWRACPGGNSQPSPKVCSGNGRCVLNSKDKARCECFQNFHGQDCSVSCENAGRPGGPCHQDYGWGKCVFDVGTQSATCKCILGAKGTSCQYPCPGKGTDLYGKYIKKSCADRGTCHLPEEVKFPGDHRLTHALKDARNLTFQILTSGIGKYKGAYDVKRLLGVDLPGEGSLANLPHYKGVLAHGDCEDSAGNSVSKEKCSPLQRAMATANGFPPKDTAELDKMKKSLAIVDHTALCQCHSNDVFGTSCQILCPKLDGRVCSGRGPDPRFTGNSQRNDPWFGPQLMFNDEWVNEYEGCMWGLFDAGGQLANRWSDGKKKVFYRDVFVDPKSAPARIKTKGKNKGKRYVYPQQRPMGVVADCRCWKEVGFTKNEYTCWGAPPGANWEASGANICGGQYKFSGEEATAGIAEVWGVEEQAKKGFKPVQYTDDRNKDFRDQIETAANEPRRGDPIKSPMTFPVGDPGGVYNVFLNKCSAYAGKRWRGKQEHETNCETQDGVKGFWQPSPSGRTCRPSDMIYEDPLTEWHGTGIKAGWYDREQPMVALSGMEIRDGFWNLRSHKVAIRRDYYVKNFAFEREDHGTCYVAQENIKRINRKNAWFVTDNSQLRHQIEAVLVDPTQAIEAYVKDKPTTFKKFMPKPVCRGFVHTLSPFCQWWGFVLGIRSCDEKIRSPFTGYCVCDTKFGEQYTHLVGCNHEEFTCKEMCDSPELTNKLAVKEYKQAMCEEIRDPSNIIVPVKPRMDQVSAELLHPDVECRSDDVNLGDANDKNHCAAKCHAHQGCIFFVFGKGSKTGRCYWEKTASATCLEGFHEKNTYDFYEVKMEVEQEVVHPKLDSPLLPRSSCPLTSVDYTQTKWGWPRTSFKFDTHHSYSNTIPVDYTQTKTGVDEEGRATFGNSDFQHESNALEKMAGTNCVATPAAFDGATSEPTPAPTPEPNLAAEPLTAIGTGISSCRLRAEASKKQTSLESKLATQKKQLRQLHTHFILATKMPKVSRNSHHFSKVQKLKAQLEEMKHKVLDQNKEIKALKTEIQPQLIQMKFSVSGIQKSRFTPQVWNDLWHKVFASSIYLAGSPKDTIDSIHTPDWTKLAHSVSIMSVIGQQPQNVDLLQLTSGSNAGLEATIIDKQNENSVFLARKEFIGGAGTKTVVSNVAFQCNKFMLASPANVHAMTKENFLALIRGWIKIERAGKYTFYTTSIDGSSLYIDSKLVVNNDGVHGAKTKKGDLSLTAGYHHIEVVYFYTFGGVKAGNGGSQLIVEYEGPGIAKKVIPPSVLSVNKFSAQNGDSAAASNVNGTGVEELLEMESPQEDFVVTARVQLEHSGRKFNTISGIPVEHRINKAFSKLLEFWPQEIKATVKSVAPPQIVADELVPAPDVPSLHTNDINGHLCTSDDCVAKYLTSAPHIKAQQHAVEIATMTAKIKQTRDSLKDSGDALNASEKMCQSKGKDVKASMALLQSDGSVKLKHKACAVGHVCTFDVKQSFKGGSGSQMGGRPASSTRNDIIDSSYIVDVENLGGSDTAHLMKLHVSSMCGATQDSASTGNRNKRYFDAEVTKEVHDDLLEHPVYFMQTKNGACSDYCYHPDDTAKVRDTKKSLMRGFCVSLAQTDAATKETGATTVKPDELYETTHAHGVEAPYKRQYSISRAKDDDGKWKVAFKDDHTHESLLQVETPLSMSNQLNFRSVMAHGVSGVLSQGMILLDQDGNVEAIESEKNIHVGDELPVDTAHGAHVTEIFGTNFTMDSECPSNMKPTQNVSEVPQTKGWFDSQKYPQADSAIVREIPDSRSPNDEDDKADRTRSQALPKNLKLDGGSFNKIKKLRTVKVDSKDLYKKVIARPRCAAFALYLPEAPAEAPPNAQAENWNSEPMVQVQLLRGQHAHTKHIRSTIETHLPKASDEADGKSHYHELLNLVLNDEYAVKHVASQAHQNTKVVKAAMDVLGAASTGGHLKSICHEAQKEVVKLIQTGKCKDECAVHGITHLGLVKHSNDLHPGTVNFLLQHAAMPDSPHWEGSSLMLGALARHTKNPELVKHALKQLAHLKKLTKLSRGHTHRKRVLLHSLGNAGHAVGRRELREHLDDKDSFIQMAAAKALGNTPPGDLGGEVLLAAIGANPKRRPHIRRLACQALEDREHPMATACSKSIKNGSRRLTKAELAAHFEMPKRAMRPNQVPNVTLTRIFSPAPI